MSRKPNYLAAAILSFVVAISLSYVIYVQWRTYSKGDLVVVTIVSLPRKITSRCYIGFEYNGKRYTRYIRSGLVKFLQIGTRVQMKHLEWSDFFLYPDEDNPAVMGLFGISLLLTIGIWFVLVHVNKSNCPGSA